MKIYLPIITIVLYLWGALNPAIAACTAGLSGSSPTSIRVSWDAHSCKRIKSDKIQICWKPAGHIRDTCNHANTEVYGKKGLYSITGLSLNDEYKVKLRYQKGNNKRWKKFFKSKTSTTDLGGFTNFTVSFVGTNSISVNWALASGTSVNTVKIRMKQEHQLFWGRGVENSGSSNQAQEWNASNGGVTLDGYCPSKWSCKLIEPNKTYKLQLLLVPDDGDEEGVAAVLKVKTPSTDVNSDFDVCFYENMGQQGNRWCYKVGDVPYVGSGANDRFSSVEVIDPDVAVIAFQHSDYAGTSAIWAGNQVGLGFMDNTISSLKIIDLPDVPYHTAPGVGWSAQGAGVALQDINDNGTPELVMLGYDNPHGANSFRYRIGWDIQPTGAVNGWSSTNITSGVGWEGQGAGIAFANLDANPRPEMVLMAVDNPQGANSLRYRVGWNVSTSGQTANWTGFTVGGLGWESDGAGIAFTNLDNNPRPEMILMAYDDPDKSNSYRYRIGWNVDSNGAASTWSNSYTVSGQGWAGEGAGIAMADLGKGPQPEMVLMAYNAPDGSNGFRFKIGWDVQSNGHATSWTTEDELEGLGHIGHGADIAIGNIDADPEPETIFMALDPYFNGNQFRYYVAD